LAILQCGEARHKLLAKAAAVYQQMTDYSNFD